MLIARPHASLVTGMCVHDGCGAYSRYAGRELMSGLLAPGVPYSAKFSRVFNFVNFMNFQPFTKLFQQNLFTRKLQFSRTRALMDNMLPNSQGTLSKEIPLK